MKLSPLVLCIFCTACTTAPEKTVTVQVPVSVPIPCQATFERPEVCKPKDDSRVEALRCFLADRITFMAYSQELEGKIQACR